MATPIVIKSLPPPIIPPSLVGYFHNSNELQVSASVDWLSDWLNEWMNESSSPSDSWLLFININSNLVQWISEPVNHCGIRFVVYTCSFFLCIKNMLCWVWFVCHHHPRGKKAKKNGFINWVFVPFRQHRSMFIWLCSKSSFNHRIERCNDRQCLWVLLGGSTLVRSIH